jgi:molecular chaperone DnaJ
MAALDYYRILGVKPNCSLEEVRRRYRLLARRHHPDLNPEDPEAAGRFRLIAAAFEAIQADRAQARAKGRSQRNAANYRPPRFTGREQVFEEFFGIDQEGSPLSWSAGADFRYDLEISLVSAIKGMGTVIAVDHQALCRCCGGNGMAAGTAYQECPECQGRGRRYGGPGVLRFGPVCSRCRGRGKIVAVPCGNCGGEGRCSQLKEYPLRIPPGTQDGARFRIMGEGGEGFQNGPRGNLSVVVHVAPHDYFTRVGNDIHCQVEVSFAEAALGCAIRIPTLNGYQWVDLPQGTQSGWSCRFPGAGAPGTTSQSPGDQVNEVIVTTSQNLRLQQRSILDELERLEVGQLDRAGHE